MKTVISLSEDSNLKELSKQLVVAKKVFAKAVDLAKTNTAVPAEQMRKTLGNALSDMRAYLDRTIP